MVITKMRMGFTPGRVTWRKRCQAEAPSTWAASYNSGDIVCKADKKYKTLVPRYRQVEVNTRATIPVILVSYSHSLGLIPINCISVFNGVSELLAKNRRKKMPATIMDVNAGI